MAPKIKTIYIWTVRDAVQGREAAALTIRSVLLCRYALQVDWSTFVAVNGTTAHPHYDPDGTCFNMGNSYGGKGKSSALSCLLASDRPKVSPCCHMS